MTWGYSKKKGQAYVKRPRIRGVESSVFPEGISEHKYKTNPILQEEPEINAEELEEFAKSKAILSEFQVQEVSYPTENISYLNPNGKYLQIKDSNNLDFTHSSILSELAGEEMTDDPDKYYPFMKKEGLVRVLKYPDEINVEVVAPITYSQLDEIRNLVKEGNENINDPEFSLNLEVYSDNKFFPTSDFNKFVKELKNRNLLS